VFPYYFLRFSGPLLLILVGLKILSGYALVGKLGGGFWLSGLHENRGLDFLLLLGFIFHSLYGIRLFLIDFGMKQERLLFWAFTILGLAIFVFCYFSLLR
jgi:succinate dehydrogenase/fumarate reductase cytochrome b subunit